MSAGRAELKRVNVKVCYAKAENHVIIKRM